MWSMVMFASACLVSQGYVANSVCLTIKLGSHMVKGTYFQTFFKDIDDFYVKLGVKGPQLLEIKLSIYVDIF